MRLADHRRRLSSCVRSGRTSSNSIPKRPKRWPDLLVAGNSLERFPHRGRRVPGTEMRELVTIYPYIIRYRVTRNGLVRILRVRHAAQQQTKP
jgi:plasmid stabilization system protein ParE